MASGDYLFELRPVLLLILERPAAAPGDPDPVEVCLLEQTEHLLELAVVDVGQHLLFLGAELFAPPGALRLPALNLPTIQPDKTKIPLFRPRRNVLWLGAIQFRPRHKRLGAAAQRGGDQN